MAKKKKVVFEQDSNFEINNLDDFKRVFKEVKNPLEKMMAANLLTWDISFIYQYEVDLPEGWSANGRKYFIIDFYIPEYDIAIETDGKIHNQENQVELDRTKNNMLTAMGIHVFRFSWNEVMKNDDEWSILHFLEMLMAFIDDRGILSESKKS